MKTRLVAIWAAAWWLGRNIADRFRPLDRVGLDTVDDAEEFIADMWRSAPDEVTAPIPVVEQPVVVFLADPVVLAAPSVFDVLTEEWPAVWARRERALRMPTVEMRAVFDDMTALLAFDYVCTHCETAGHHTDCPGCSCPCAMAVA